jgi:hypothetical protein
LRIFDFDWNSAVLHFGEKAELPFWNLAKWTLILQTFILALLLYSKVDNYPTKSFFGHFGEIPEGLRGKGRTPILEFSKVDTYPTNYHFGIITI